jgi:hypothetical protein
MEIRERTKLEELIKGSEGDQFCEPLEKTPEDVLASFRQVSAIGYRIIQIQWISPDVPIDFIRDALKETQLYCVGTQDFYDLVVPDLDQVIKMNDLWGGTYICVSGIPEHCRSYAGCLEFAKELDRLSASLEKKGKIFSIDTPPPYVNTPIHIGQATTYVLMDMFARFRRCVAKACSFH